MAKLKRTVARYRIQELNLITMSVIGLLITYAFVLVSPENNFQALLTAPLVICSIIFSCAWCLPAARSQSNGQIDWLHPAVLVVVVYFAYFVFPGVWLWLMHDYNPMWIRKGRWPVYLVNTAFFLGALSMAAFGWGCRSKLAFPGSAVRNFLSQTRVLRFKEARFLIILFFVVGMIVKLYHLSLLGPLSLDLLRYLSPSERRGTDINLSMFVVMLESMLDWSLLLAMFFYLMHYLKSGSKNGLFLLVIFTACIILLDYVVSSKRSGVILFFLLPFILYHYLIKRLTFSKAIASLALGGGLIGVLLIVRIALPLISKDMNATDYIGEGFWDVVKFYFDTPEWASFEMVLASINQREELLDNAGGTIVGFLKYSFGTLFVFIPRVIWPGKPDYEDLSHLYYHTIFQVSDNVGIAPTIWAASYLFFHVTGLAIGMYVLGWLFKGVYNLLRPYQGRPYNVFFYAIFFWMAFQFLRFGTTGFLLLYFIQAILVGVMAALFLARKGRGVRVATCSMARGKLS